MAIPDVSGFLYSGFGSIDKRRNFRLFIRDSAAQPYDVALEDKPMKYIAIFAAALIGGVAGAAGLYFLAEQQDTAASAPTRKTAEAVDHSDEIANLEQDNAALRQRIEKLEAESASQPDTASTESTTGPASSTDLEDFKKAVLEAAREEAKVVAEKTSADAAAGSGLSEAEQRKVFVSSLKDQLKSTDAGLRREAIRKLRHLKERSVSAEIQLRLSDENAKVRREAAEYFEDVWDKEARTKLTDMMMNDEDLKVQEHALDALNESGDEDAIRELVNAYLNAKAIETAYEAGKALEENNRKEELPKGLQRFRDALTDNDPVKREYGVVGLRKWGTSADEPYVRPLLDDKNPDVQDEARRAMRRWGFDQ
ncbi:MAG: HEAT repeat domain-containing protein [Planctomycetota bacterium]|jgi:hypothetical protein